MAQVRPSGPQGKTGGGGLRFDFKGPETVHQEGRRITPLRLHGYLGVGAAQGQHQGDRHQPH
jgi:hypothetical protein